MSKGISFDELNGKDLRIALVVARWNSDLTNALLEDATLALRDAGVEDAHILIEYVPGSFELVYATKQMIDAHKPDAVIAIGALIKGETMHFEYIASAVTEGIMKLNIETNTPVIFGVLTCLNEAQAKARAEGSHNHGYSWGKTAIEMALLKKRIV